MKFDDMLKELGEDIFTEELRTKITKMYDAAVSESVKQQVGLVVDSELEKIDEEHAKQLEGLLESIDQKHLEQMESLVESIDQNYTNKLVTLAEAYENELKDGANTLRESLARNISNYLDVYLDKAFPADTVKEAVENTKAARMVAKIMDVVGIDPEYMSESVKDAIAESKTSVDVLSKQLEDATKKNSLLVEEITKLKTSLVLEQKIQGFNQTKRDYIKRRLQNKSLEEIEENYKFVLEMYERDELDKRDAVRARTETQTISKKIDVPCKTITEKVEDRKASSYDEVDVVLDALNELA